MKKLRYITRVNIRVTERFLELVRQAAGAEELTAARDYSGGEHGDNEALAFISRHLTDPG